MKQNTTIVFVLVLIIVFSVSVLFSSLGVVREGIDSTQATPTVDSSIPITHDTANQQMVVSLLASAFQNYADMKIPNTPKVLSFRTQKFTMTPNILYNQIVPTIKQYSNTGKIPMQGLIQMDSSFVTVIIDTSYSNTNNPSDPPINKITIRGNVITNTIGTQKIRFNTDILVSNTELVSVITNPKYYTPPPEGAARNPQNDFGVIVNVPFNIMLLNEKTLNIIMDRNVQIIATYNAIV